MLNGILIIALFLILAVLMFTRKIPTLLAIPIMAIGIAIIAGVPFGGDNGVLSQIIQKGATRLADAYAVLIFSTWLGQIMLQTGISKSIIKFAAELGGDKPLLISISLFIAMSLVFTTLTGLGSIIMIGGIVFPILLSVGVPGITAAGIFLFAYATGAAINVGQWTYYAQLSGASFDVIKIISLVLAGLTAIAGLTFLVLELRKAGVKKYWAKPQFYNNGENEKEVPKLAMFTPIIPLIFVIGFGTPVIPAFLLAILFAVITLRKSFAETINLITKAAYEGVSDAAPAVMLMIGIGMLLNAVFHPVVSDVIGPFLRAVIPSSTLGYVIFFSVLAPLALYRGPLNMWGLGSGIVGLMIAIGIVPAPAAIGAMLSTERIQITADPTNTHNVWIANYVDVDVVDILKKLLPYAWVIAVLGIIFVSVFYM